MGFTLWFIVLYVSLILVLFTFLVLPLVRGTKSLLEAEEKKAWKQ